MIDWFDSWLCDDCWCGDNCLDLIVIGLMIDGCDLCDWIDFDLIDGFDWLDDCLLDLHCYDWLIDWYWLVEDVCDLIGLCDDMMIGVVDWFWLIVMIIVCVIMWDLCDWLMIGVLWSWFDGLMIDVIGLIDWYMWLFDWLLDLCWWLIDDVVCDLCDWLIGIVCDDVCLIDCGFDLMWCDWLIVHCDWLIVMIDMALMMMWIVCDWLC